MEADISAVLVGVAVVVLGVGVLVAVATWKRRRFNRLRLLVVGCVCALAAFFWWIGWTSKIARYVGS
jgi:4-amino-4-deoxy-L-arabinose transferase-like glycosyltransferase